MTPEEKLKLNELYQFMQSLKDFKTIPFNVQEAFRSRLQGGGSLSKSSKGVDTEDQAVNEGGAGTYNVLKEPDGFLEINISGITYYIPYYD